MDALTEIKEDIKRFLLLGSHPNLADCLDDVDDKYLEALYNMICKHYQNRTQKTISAFQVTEDVAAILEGKPELAEFSKPFIVVR